MFGNKKQKVYEVFYFDMDKDEISTLEPKFLDWDEADRFVYTANRANYKKGFFYMKSVEVTLNGKYGI